MLPVAEPHHRYLHARQSLRLRNPRTFDTYAPSCGTWSSWFDSSAHGQASHTIRRVRSLWLWRMALLPVSRRIVLQLPRRADRGTQWICRRCSLQLLARRHGTTASRRVLNTGKQKGCNRLLATQSDDRHVGWREWFDSAAPYGHTSSNASTHDRGNRSYHAREPPLWLPPIRLSSSLNPYADGLRQKPDRPYMNIRTPRPSIITILPPEESKILRDADWVLRNTDYPTWKEYPWAPEELFSEQTTFGAIQDAFDLVKPRDMSVHGRFNLVRPQSEQEQDYWKHHLLANFKEGNREPITVVGEARYKSDAAVSSYMQLFAALHAEGLLSAPENSAHLRNLSSPGQATQRDWTSLMQTYNLAAHFGAIPRFETTRIDQELSDGWHVTVSFTTIDGVAVQGEATAISLQDAQLAACSDLRRQAENMQVLHEEGEIDLRSPEHVNIDNAAVLLRLFAAKNPASSLRLHAASESLEDGSLAWSVGYKLNQEHLEEPISMPSKRKATGLADLVAALHLTQRFPSLWEDFKIARDRAYGLQLPHLTPFEASDLSSLEPLMKPIVETLQRGRLTDPAQPPDTAVQVDALQSRGGIALMGHFERRTKAHAEQISRETRSENLRLSQEYYWYNPALDILKQERLALPTMQYRQELLNLINGNPYSVVIGATASGKSTQIPQILLEDAIHHGYGASCNIICTQPRRIAAQALARRVSTERDEILGEVVGFQISGEYVVAELDGSITYCTPELLTVQLEMDEDKVLDGTSHILIDEAHERGFQTDRVLTALKAALNRRRAAGRPTPSLTVMSATLYAEEFQDFLTIHTPDGTPFAAPLLEIPGRVHPVHEHYLEDLAHAFESTLTNAEREFVQADDRTRGYVADETAMLDIASASRIDETYATPPIQWRSMFEMSDREEGPSPRLTAATVAHALRSRPDGDILVFLSGFYMIADVRQELEQHAALYFAGIPDYEILVLHSMQSKSLDEALQPSATGARRIFLATDIAETSLTFSYVNQVIDTGRRRSVAKHSLYGVDYLPEIWITQSNAVQRAGRAGRVQEGDYYALFSSARRQMMAPTMATRTTSPVELMRTSLRALTKYPEQSLAKTLAPAMNPPTNREISETLAFLRNLGALAGSGDVTDLGTLLSKIPLYGRSGLLIPLGMMFNCLEPMLIIAVSSDENQFFRRGTDRHSMRRAQTMRLYYSRGSHSDHLAIVNAYRELRQVRQDQGSERAEQWATDSFIDYSRFEAIDRQVSSLAGLMVGVGITPAYPLPLHSNRNDDDNLVLALAAAALYPNIGVEKDRNRFTGPLGFDCSLSQFSNVRLQGIAAKRADKDDKGAKHGLIGFSRYQYFDRDYALVLNASRISPLAVMLFGGKLELKPDTSDVLITDGWLSFNVGNEEAAQTILQLRQAWDVVWRNAIREFANGLQPGIGGVRDRKLREEFVQGITDLLALEKDGVTTVAEYSTETQQSLDLLAESRSPQTFDAVQAGRARDAFDEMEEADGDQTVYGRTNPEERMYERPAPPSPPGDVTGGQVLARQPQGVTSFVSELPHEV